MAKGTKERPRIIKHYVLDLPLGICDMEKFIKCVWLTVTGGKGRCGRVTHPANPKLRPAAERLATRFVSDVYSQLKRNHEGGGLDKRPPVAHRDIKPANVVVCKTAEDKIYFRIVDYGLAVTGDADDTAGTPYYTHPKTVTCGGKMSLDLSKNQDIWGAGACFHWAFTGSQPGWMDSPRIKTLHQLWAALGRLAWASEAVKYFDGNMASHYGTGTPNTVEEAREVTRSLMQASLSPNIAVEFGALEKAVGL